MTPLRRAEVQSCNDGVVLLALESGWNCRVSIVADGVGRVFFTPPDGLREERTWAITTCLDSLPFKGRAGEGMVLGGEVNRAATENHPPPNLPLEGRGAERSALFASSLGVVSQSLESVTLSSKTLRAKITLEPFCIVWEQCRGDSWLACCKDRPTYGYASEKRSGQINHWQARDEHDQYYGLGDKTGALNKAGRRFRTRQLDALGYNGETSDPLYKHWPFFLGRRADTGSTYGIYYDTLAECAFDFGQEFDNYHEFYRATEIADGDLDYYVFAGPDVPSALSRFMQLIGGTAFPPRWSLGYANTAMALADFHDAQAQIRGFLALAERDKFPLSSFHFGSGYTSHGKQRYVFTWNTDKFPDARSLLAAFKTADVRTMANLKPCLLNDHPSYAAIEANGGFVRNTETGKPCLDQFWDGWGAHLDFTRDLDRDWWQQNFREQVLDFGIDTGWNDNNEYEIWSETGSSDGNGKPVPIHRSRALHALLMTQATAAAQAAARPDERVYTVTRAGPPGLQRYAQTWSGDNTTSWHTMRWNQRMALSMSLSGMFNIGHDIGGFAGPVPNAEMLIRWTQACCLLPRMIMNSWKVDGSVNSPWLHADATASIRDSIGLRLHLMPYLYTLMWQAATEHTPVLRPTFFHFGDDPNTWQDNDEMMVGGELLVAPVFQDAARRRTLYLPRGVHAEGWFNFWTGEYLEGGRTVEVDAPLDRLPLFVRAGALLPTTDTNSDAKKTEEPTRALRYFAPPPASRLCTGSALLFEDNGLQTTDADDQHVVHTFNATSDSDGLRIHVSQRGNWALPYQSVRVILPRGETRPLHLTTTGVSLKQ
ncbi:MAG: TIM-barrel domain-containing protein [Casimicrobium sp.]